jgi:flagellar basal body rod protein FlgG
MLRNDAGLTPAPVTHPTVRSGSLEGSNVSVAERLAQLTDVSRSFEALQKAISMVMNEVDGKSIEMLGRR